MTNPAPTILDAIDALNAVTSFRINFGDILLQVSGATPRLVHDYVAFQTIDQSGWIFAPDAEKKLELAKWFMNRNCTVEFVVNPQMEFSRLERWKVSRLIKKLNVLIEAALVGRAVNEE